MPAEGSEYREGWVVGTDGSGEGNYDGPVYIIHSGSDIDVAPVTGFEPAIEPMTSGHFLMKVSLTDGEMPRDGEVAMVDMVKIRSRPHSVPWSDTANSRKTRKSVLDNKSARPK